MGGPKDAADSFRLLFEAAPHGVIAVDEDGRILRANRLAEGMFGYARDELIGRPVETLVPERFRSGHARLRKQAADAPRMRPMGTNRDLFGRRKDGSEFPIEVGLNFIAAENGRMVAATVVDITERKKAEEVELLFEHAQGKLETCQQLGMPAAVLRQDGKVLLRNALLDGLKSQFIVERDAVRLPNPTENELFLQRLRDLDRDNVDQVVRSTPIRATDEHPPMVFHLLPMQGPLGSMLGILVVTTLDSLSMPSADLVQGLFALPPAEARVAALIGAGLSPRETAQQLGISEGNVRTTLKHVFGKVGVNRQNELAVLLAKLALH